MDVDVSVLTPVLNEEEHIREVAAKMLSQRFDGSIEFLFIDGASGDATVDILRELQQADPRIRILENPRRSTPISLNIGLSEARGAFIARMDAHTLYPEDYLARGVARLRRGGAAHVSGPQLARGEGVWSRRVAMALDTPLGRGGAQFRQVNGEEIEVDSGFTGVWPRSVLEAHGGWHEDWHNDQDFELAARIRGSGGRIVCLPEMGAQYIPRNSLSSLARQYWRYGVYRVKTSRAHPETMRRSHLLAPTVAVAAAGTLLPLGPVRRLARAGMAAWCAAVVGMAMVEAWRADSSAADFDTTAGDIASLPAVFGAMHLAWGFGFLFGCVRFGPPVRAVRKLLRRDPA
jgi:succinoglycan biosynthesis protein ExoA